MTPTIRPITFVLVACLNTVCLGGPTEAECREAQTLLDQAFDHGESWRQGIVEFTTERRGAQITRKEFLAFDRDAGLMRFDCEEDDRGRIWVCKHADTPDEILLSTGKPNFPNPVVRHAPDQPPNLPKADPYDLAALTVAEVGMLLNGAGKLEDVRIFYTERFPLKADRVVAFRRDGRKVEATWEVPAPKDIENGRDLRRTFVFDLDAGGLPVRALGEIREPTAEWTKYVTTKIQWQPVKETWVPTRWESVDTFGSGYDMTMTFDWKSLNEPLPKKLFAMEDMGLDPRSMVVSAKLGPQVIEGPVQEVINPPTETKGFEITGGSRWKWIAVNGVLLLAIVLIVLFLRRRAA